MAVSIGGVEERVSSQANQVQAEKAQLDKQKKRVQAIKVRPTTCTIAHPGQLMSWLICRVYLKPSKHVQMSYRL